MFSIYILTHNEEIDIAACIESAQLSNDIIVVDSFSNDRTVEIAQRYPVRVIQHAFESHGEQRSWMLRSIPTKHEWVYILEADERMTPELFRECLQVIKSPDNVGYYAAERVMFMGTWIRHSTQYPRYQLRLLKKGQVWFSDYGHTEREVCLGATGFLQETYPHYTCSKGLSRWIEKHNRYSSDEARETLSQLENGAVKWWDLFFGDNEVARRRALKDLSLRLPCRPLLRWLYMYFILGGIRDGKAGFAWCTLQAFYEYLILLKAEEIKTGNFTVNDQIIIESEQAIEVTSDCC
ncbi:MULTISPECIES: glycosyltransferase family 2 protein [unclassified Microcystis]|jgi:glycosyltransferase involved in cell wall biosynthesis|uniref:glycosyltransferase family 2 protein n=1 Tax=unclassified Microcystis TaxID=2643300 RepID=UPI00258ED4A0|nr:MULTISPECIES: glycosyltransferase family 2 protein [unclassified Microcystis]MCE2664610.1 glycosyltransferase family 2 protein [Microcystis sp. 53602_E8]MDJ0545073.1 glycosyltransferase family 2 protein [Microcystis sp. M53601_WE4]MDJ0564685.1 glycosyltransferase family 2 protein [Microcystis sp. M49629_WE12]MDJ0541876.1 glycosyltransferase family 2 protein [Microcystis sp. M53603_WE2]MDJ0602349.1 glycosyltransferase family 2 protein [Microcystis sp. M53602_WE12]